MKSFKKILASVCSLVMLSAIATYAVSANDELGSSIGSSIGASVGESGSIGESEVTPGTSNEPEGPGTSSGTGLLLGDVNVDGQVKTNDLLLLKKHLLGLVEADQVNLVNADVTKDGEIKSNDLLLLKKYLLGIINTL